MSGPSVNTLKLCTLSFKFIASLYHGLCILSCTHRQVILRFSIIKEMLQNRCNKKEVLGVTG